MPTRQELAESEERISEFVRLAEDVGVWYGSHGKRAGVSVNRLQTVFAHFSQLAGEFPEHRGRVGRFLAEFLVPSLLRVIDASRRDLGPDGGGSLEPIVGMILVNKEAMARWAQEIETRLIGGQDGFVNLYWARDLRMDFPEEAASASRARYQALFDECESWRDECDPDVLSGLQQVIADYTERLGAEGRANQ